MLLAQIRLVELNMMVLRLPSQAQNHSLTLDALLLNILVRSPNGPAKQAISFLRPSPQALLRAVVVVRRRPAFEVEERRLSHRRSKGL